MVEGVIYVEVAGPDKDKKEKNLVWLQPATVIENPTGPILWLCMDSVLPQGFQTHGTVKAYYPPLAKEMRPSACN